MRRPLDISWSRQLAGISVSQIALWAAAGTMAMAAHGTAGWWIMQERPAPMIEAAAPAAIMIEFAPLPAAPSAPEDQIAPDEIDAEAAEEAPAEPIAEEVEVAEPIEPEPEPEPEPVEPELTEPEPVEELAEELPEPIETSEPVDPVEQLVAALDPVELPLPQSRPEPPRKKPAPVKAKAKPKAQQPSAEKRRAQVKAPQEAPRAAAAQNSTGATQAAISPARWQARLASHLERRKRYPATARQQRQQGTAQVRFTVDASGNVKSVALVRSSGVPVLDEEVVALVHRASPVPAPPPGVNRTIVVPIRFSVR